MQMSSASAELEPRSDLLFKGYALVNVYLRTTEAQRSEILALWCDEAVPVEGAEADRRSREAVLLVRAPSGELAGVSTVSIVRLKDGRRFYSCTLLLRKRDQAVPYLGITVSDATRDFLRNFKHPVAQPAGMLNVNENPRLARPGVRRLFERHGYRYYGQTADGEDVWITEFGDQVASVVSPDAQHAPGNQG